MKTLLFIAALIATTFTQNIFAQDNIKQPQLSQLLTYYYEIKNALVDGSTGNASINATAFIKTAGTVDNKTISEDTIKALINDAAKIAENKKLEKQREYFERFSSNMIAVAKGTRLSDQPIYQEYCPMKKAYWLSSEKTIKNPYYGSSMLTCGRVTGTL